MTTDPTTDTAALTARIAAKKAEPAFRDAAKVLEAPVPLGVVQAQTLREAAAEIAAMDPAEAALAGQYAFHNAAAQLHRMANEAEFVATPCDPMVQCEDGGEPCHTHERLMSHYDGSHELCEPGCAASVPVSSTVPAPTTPVCLCGHPMHQHHEDVCLTECGCQDGREPETALDLPDRLQAALTARFTESGNPGSAMRRHEQGPDGWPASHPVGPRVVAEVLRELLGRAEAPESAVLPAPVDRATVEADVDTVAARATQVITTMGADIRALTSERDRYRTAWRSARERAQAFGEGILLHVAQRDFWQKAAEQNYKLYAAASEELRRLAGGTADIQTETPAFTPPAHYQGRDGTEYCVHATPIVPDSCPACRELADTDRAAAGPSAVDEVVAALTAKAQALSVEAEEEMRRDLEEQAQVWHEAAELARRTGRKAGRRTQPAAGAGQDGAAS